MSDKPVAFLVTVLVAAPLCSLCILGPAVVGAFLGGIFGWLGDAGAVQAIALGVGAAILAFGWSRYRRARCEVTNVPETEPHR